MLIQSAALRQKRRKATADLREVSGDSRHASLQDFWEEH
jgi:hypothetical protein